MKKIIHFSFFIVFALTTAFIFSNSMRSADVSGLASAPFVDLAEKFLRFFHLPMPADLTYAVRKAAHITEFALQSFFFCGWFLTGKRYFPSCIIYVMFAGLLTACTDELIQVFFDGRGSMVQDIFIDFAGTCGALLMMLIFWFLFGRRSRRRHIF